MRRFLGIVFSFVLAGAWLAGDYFSKIWAVEHLSYGSKKIIPFLDFHLAFNEGAAFSMLSNQGGWQKWFFILLAVIVGLWLIWELLFEKLDMTARFAYASILGGAAGNAYDRYIDGKVVDFILVHYKEHSFPIFNVADIGITIGAVLIVMYAIANWWGANSITAIRR